MSDFKKRLDIFKGARVQVACVLALIVLAVFLLWFNTSNSLQAAPALIAQVYFDGEYKVDGGEWKEITATRPPGARCGGTASRARSISPSSSLTAIRSA